MSEKYNELGYMELVEWVKQAADKYPNVKINEDSIKVAIEFEEKEQSRDLTEAECEGVIVPFHSFSRNYNSSDYVTEVTELEQIRRDPWSLFDIEQTVDLCLEAIKIDPMVMDCIKPSLVSKCLEAIQKIAKANVYEKEEQLEDFLVKPSFVSFQLGNGRQAFVGGEISEYMGIVYEKDIKSNKWMGYVYDTRQIEDLLGIQLLRMLWKRSKDMPEQTQAHGKEWDNTFNRMLQDEAVLGELLQDIKNE